MLLLSGGDEGRPLLRSEMEAVLDSPVLMALSKQVAISRQLQVASVNIANASTPGFRKKEMNFAALLHEVRERDPLSYPFDKTTYLDLTPGAVNTTDNPLDVTIAGNPRAFFVIDDNGRQVLTRAGNFTLDGTGRLTASNGKSVVGVDDRPIIVNRSAQSIAVGSDGSILEDGRPVGRLKVLQLMLGADAELLGDAELNAPGSTEPPSAYTVQAGSLEGSNVDSVADMTRLIELSRNFEMLQQAISMEDSRKQDVVDKMTQF
jgi:flagellar basal-body rod protein FlgF